MSDKRDVFCLQKALPWEVVEELVCMDFAAQMAAGYQGVLAYSIVSKGRESPRS